MVIRFSPVVFLLLLLLPVEVQAQTSFTVTVETKSADHPNDGMGHPAAFVIDGEEANELTLVRGETYTFQMDGTPVIHPFYLSTSESGGGAEPYTEGVTGSGATGDEALTFVVPMEAPDLLWYQCQVHLFMGWRLNIVNPTATEDGAQPQALVLGAPFPNPFADRTALTLTLETPQEVTVEVFDVSGRRVATLHDGALPRGEHPLALDGTGLGDGVYVVRVQSGDEVVERRVTLAR